MKNYASTPERTQNWIYSYIHITYQEWIIMKQQSKWTNNKWEAWINDGRILSKKNPEVDGDFYKIFKGELISTPFKLF